jgi:hypothetical protein
MIPRFVKAGFTPAGKMPGFDPLRAEIKPDAVGWKALWISTAETACPGRVLKKMPEHQIRHSGESRNPG